MSVGLRGWGALRAAHKPLQLPVHLNCGRLCTKAPERGRRECVWQGLTRERLESSSNLIHRDIEGKSPNGSAARGFSSIYPLKMTLNELQLALWTEELASWPT